jgi:hypothetical protein
MRRAGGEKRVVIAITAVFCRADFKMNVNGRIQM